MADQGVAESFTSTRIAAATGKPILGMYIHLPLIGAIVALSEKI